MGGNPCRLKDILDNGNAAQRGFECMRNTANIAAAFTTGQAKVSDEAYKLFVSTADEYAKACAAVEAELAENLPPE